MLTNSSQISEALKSGATVVVPSRQRAAAVRLAASGAALRQGLELWWTADVLPWQGWLSRECGAVRHRLPQGSRLLQPTESWLIWRAIADRLADERGLLSAAGLASALPRSLMLMQDWALRWSGDPGAESELLRTARSERQRRCQSLGALDPSDWSLLAQLPDMAQGAPLALAGLGSVGTARSTWLSARGAVALSPDGTAGATPMMHAATDAAAELEAAARWCRARIAADPQARLLVVVPGMDRLRPRLLRTFGRVLQPASTAATGAPAFALEGGQALADFGLVATALTLLAIGVRALPFSEFAALLRAPYLALGTLESACRLELWLRDRNITSVDVARLRRLQPAVERELGAAVSSVIERLLQCVPGAVEAQATGSRARWYVAQLQTAGWPGQEPLSSDELQVRRRFEELLGDLAAAGAALPMQNSTEALRMLEALARDSAYEPATDDVPVTVTARPDDPVVRYDGIWVCGCDAARFPGPPAPDAYIPLAVQLAAGIPEASAEGQLVLARRALAAWCAATPELILSYAATEEDAEQAPSGLLDGLVAWRQASATQVAVAAAPLEAVTDASGPTWPRGRRLAGGVQALQLQAECPFRAFAQLRLDAQPVPEPLDGVDARLRGRALHRALEVVWRGLQDSSGLQALSPPQQQQRVGSAVRAALAAELAASDTQLPAMLVRAEERRTAAVIAMLLDSERKRAPFRVAQIEAQRQLQLGDLQLWLRLDRVDALEDGSVAILDYKSGRAESFDAHAERLRRPQLPCYALAWDGVVSAVATVHLRRDGVKWRGAADTDGRLPDVHAAASAAEEWQPLLLRWRSRLGALVQEFAAGAASVTPQPRACEYCHLGGLCRVDAAGTLSDAQESADDD